MQETMRDTTYTVLGLGLLGFQRAQVRRRQLERELRDPAGPVRTQLAGARGDLGRLVIELDHQIDPVLARVDRGLDAVEESLPGGPGQVLRRVRRQAAGMRTELVGRLSKPG